jgi:hypothetical protein
MGLFDKMFRNGADTASGQPSAEKRFKELKQRYQQALTTAGRLYGDSHEYMRIFYANRNTLKDPYKVQVGQQLTIPAGS